MTSDAPQPDYTKEVRFAVVMYGGVSLAIYINGIAQEMLRLVRSTAARQVPDLKGTERIYRKVSYLMENENMSMAELEKASADTTKVPPTRFVVDILSGTSAGGINGIFLAKALANGQSMDELKNLWVTEGDIETLINDRRSIEKPLVLRNPPTSLLNSERMYFKLLGAFDGMDKSVPDRKESDPSPFVDELDLFVTSTDLQGVVLPIRLSDDLVYERRHRNVMHFVYSERSVSGEDTRNDFFASYNPFLAFAARCTSSFPFAFEPMCLTDIDTILKMHRYNTGGDFNSSSKTWQRFYRDYLDPRGVSSVPFPKRSFGDGGYLDNKPFSYATEALMNRNADVPVDRKLVYIEPSPEHPEDDAETDVKPDAIENTMAALLTLPRYETIREDLERVKERNRLIERVSKITTGVDRDEEAVRQQVFSKAREGDADAWKQLGALVLPKNQEWSKEFVKDEDTADLDLADMIRRNGRAYAAYHRLRIAAVTDELAKLIARVAGFDENSDYFVVIRSMVRAWRVQTYVEHRVTPEEKAMPTANRFLYEFDLSYPIRRVNYLRNKADALHRQEPDARTLINILAKTFGLDIEKQAFTEAQDAAFEKEILRFKRTLNDIFVDLRRAGRSLRSRHSTKVQKDKDTAQAEPEASPVKTEVETLIGKINDAVKKLSPNPDSPSLILDYFLGRRETTNGGGYKGESPEEICIRRAEEFLKHPDHKHLLDQFGVTAKALKKNVLDAKLDAEKTSTDLFASKDENPASGNLSIDTVVWIARKAMAHYYDNYEDYDLLTYPIMFETGIGEADAIDIIRISPEDAKQLIDERGTGCHKLAGSALGHFGAFLARQWRQNDILWGRLDGAERLITALIPNHPFRQQLIGEAQAQIVCETIAAMGDEERQALLAESLMRTKTRKSEATQLDGFINRLIDNSASDRALNDRLKELIDPRELRQYYEDNFRKQSRLEPESALRSAARATTVVGKILDSLSKNRGVNNKYSVWIIRLGQIFWGLVEVAVPRSFADLVFRHWLKLVYFLELLLIVGSTLLLAPAVQHFALTAFGVTAAVHLAVVIMRDLIESRNRWLNLAKAIGTVLLVTLIVIGVFALSAVLGAEFSWKVMQTVRNDLVSEFNFGFNLKTYLYGLSILVVLTVFVWTIRTDLKAAFKKGK
ncbi:MAG TPA: patatin-like protein [Pyrinomonadaceae bacterium]|nr:patatin-like protein [Pyrinomonadaceae bacterium]